MHIDISQLAHILRNAPHRWLGITTDPPDPPKSPPAAAFAGRTMQDFQYALDCAIDYWPHTQSMTLCGSDAEKLQHANQYPPGFHRLEDPEILMTFAPGEPHPARTDQGPGGSYNADGTPVQS